MASESIASNSSLTRGLIIGLLFGFLVMVVLALLSDLKAVSQQIFEFNWALYPLVLGLTLVNYLLRGFQIPLLSAADWRTTHPHQREFSHLCSRFPIGGHARKGR